MGTGAKPHRPPLTYYRLWSLIYPITCRQPAQERERWTRILIGAFVISAQPKSHDRERIKRRSEAALNRARDAMRTKSKRYDLDLMAWIELSEHHDSLKAEAPKFQRSHDQVMQFVLEELRSWFVETQGCPPPPTSPHKRSIIGREWTKMLDTAEKMMKVLFKNSNRVRKNANLVRYAREHLKGLRQKSA